MQACLPPGVSVSLLCLAGCFFFSCAPFSKYSIHQTSTVIACKCIVSSVILYPLLMLLCFSAYLVLTACRSTSTSKLLLQGFLLLLFWHLFGCSLLNSLSISFQFLCAHSPVLCLFMRIGRVLFYCKQDQLAHTFNLEDKDIHHSKNTILQFKNLS